VRVQSNGLVVITHHKVHDDVEVLVVVEVSQTGTVAGVMTFVAACHQCQDHGVISIEETALSVTILADDGVVCPLLPEVVAR